MQRGLVLVFTWLITLIQMWVAQASRELVLVIKADYFCLYSLSQLWSAHCPGIVPHTSILIPSHSEQVLCVCFHTVHAIAGII